MEHSFDIDIAQEYGIGCAIILKHLYFWIRKNRACGKNFHDGKYWTYGSTKAFCELFPYMGDKQIRNVFKKLEENNLIEIGSYNSLPFDRTKWYALTEKGFQLIEKGSSIKQNADSHSANGLLTSVQKTIDIRPKGEPIPDIYTDINTDNNTNNYYLTHNKKKADGGEKHSNRFVPPTVEEVQAYCAERNNSIDAEIFCDYYASKGWMIGRNKMKDWKAAVRTWENKEKQKPKVGDTGVELDDEIDHSLDGIF